MNHMMYSTCRYLIDLGYDCSLFLLKDELFLPQDDSYSSDYKNYTYSLDIDRISIDKDCAEIADQLSSYNFLIGSDIAPAIMTRIGRVLDIFVPHGSDMYRFPFLYKKRKNQDGVWWLTCQKLFSFLQRTNIEKIPVILFPDEYDIQFPYKNKLNISGISYNFSAPMLYHHQYQKQGQLEHLKNLDFYDFFKKIRDQHAFIVFSHSRQNGKIEEEANFLEDKGNFVLIEGFANFIKSNDINAVLILFEYGSDVGASKRLVTELEIDEYVIWCPKMKRKDIMFGLKQADVGCGQFVHSWLTCGVVNETLATGTPLLHYRQDELYLNDYDELYPILNANSPEAVSQQLQKAYENKELMKTYGDKGIEWLEKNSVNKAISVIRETIENRVSAPNFSKEELIKINKKMSSHKRQVKLMRLKQKIQNKFKKN